MKKLRRVDVSYLQIYEPLVIRVNITGLWSNFIVSDHKDILLKTNGKAKSKRGFNKRTKGGKKPQEKCIFKKIKL